MWGAFVQDARSTPPDANSRGQRGFGRIPHPDDDWLIQLYERSGPFVPRIPTFRAALRRLLTIPSAVVNTCDAYRMQKIEYIPLGGFSSVAGGIKYPDKQVLSDG